MGLASNHKLELYHGPWAFGSLFFYGWMDQQTDQRPVCSDIWEFLSKDVPNLEMKEAGLVRFNSNKEWKRPAR